MNNGIDAMIHYQLPAGADPESFGGKSLGGESFGGKKFWWGKVGKSFGGDVSNFELC